MRATYVLTDFSLVLARAAVEYTHRWLCGIVFPDKSLGTKFLTPLGATGAQERRGVIVVVVAKAMTDCVN